MNAIINGFITGKISTLYNGLIHVSYNASHKLFTIRIIDNEKIIATGDIALVETLLVENDARLEDTSKNLLRARLLVQLIRLAQGELVTLSNDKVEITYHSSMFWVNVFEFGVTQTAIDIERLAWNILAKQWAKEDFEETSKIDQENSSVLAIAANSIAVSLNYQRTSNAIAYCNYRITESQYAATERLLDAQVYTLRLLTRNPYAQALTDNSF